jgi:GTPase
MHFLDQARIRVSGGMGGDGCLCFHREKYVDMGGPDGGNGGKGGDVWVEADPRKATLADFARKPHFRGGDGGNGSGNFRTGRAGDDLVVRIPCGTLIFHEGRLLADLKEPGARFKAASGGRFGRGNASFKTGANTAPYISEKGSPGETFVLDLELKLLADVGLVGFPNAGKSTLLARISKAHPKIADYPFTTLTPNLGVARVADRAFVVADIPGLIEGAHQGKGLGDEFLRHVERTKVLIHLVDVSGFDEKPAHQNFHALLKELKGYSKTLLAKPQIVAASKMDVTGADERLSELQKKLKKTKIYPLSAVTGEGVDRLLKAALKALDSAPEAPLFIPDSAEYVLEPDFIVEKMAEGAYRVRGKKVDDLLVRTRFEQEEAVARLQKIFRKMGVERELQKRGAATGDAVWVGDHEFNFRPNIDIEDRH